MLNAGPVDFFADLLQAFQMHGSAKLALLIVIPSRESGKERQNPYVGFLLPRFPKIGTMERNLKWRQSAQYW